MGAAAPRLGYDYVCIFQEQASAKGCGGQIVDDEVRVTLAAQACLLLLHSEFVDFYEQDPSAWLTSWGSLGGVDLPRERARGCLGRSVRLGLAIGRERSRFAS